MLTRRRIHAKVPYSSPCSSCWTVGGTEVLLEHSFNSPIVSPAFLDITKVSFLYELLTVAGTVVKYIASTIIVSGSRRFIPYTTSVTEHRFGGDFFEVQQKELSA